MTDRVVKELRRRTIVKSLVWRIIGIAWTWIGAYLIILLIPPSYETAALIATLIVVYHHSTRMVMYYVYERIWTAVSWGRTDVARPMSRAEIVLWTTGTLGTIVLIFLLLIYMSPRLKAKRSANEPAPIQEFRGRGGGGGAGGGGGWRPPPHPPPPPPPRLRNAQQPKLLNIP